MIIDGLACQLDSNLTWVQSIQTVGLVSEVDNSVVLYLLFEVKYIGTFPNFNML